MKKTPIFVGMALGAIAGLFVAIPDGLGLKIVMMSIGAVAGTAVGGAISRMGKKGTLPLYEAEESYGQGTSPEDRMNNFWRDKGKVVPFSGPPDPEGTSHDFDRERY